MTTWLRLGVATLVVLAPGWAIARALGRRGASATLAWTLAAVFCALAITFAVHGSLELTLGIELALGAVALPFSRRRPRRPRARGLVALAGLAFGGALWFVCGPVGGDGLFHLARVRKLDALHGLSLHAVDEFRDGGLHPGYAFPLWHGVLALVAKVAAVDPTLVVRYEPSLLAPLAFLVAYEAGLAVFRSTWAAVAVLCGQVALYGLAAGHGGSFVPLANPGNATRLILAPALVALFFVALADRGPRAYATLAALAGGAALVHPAFAVFALLPLVGYALVRTAVARGELRDHLAALVAFAAPVVGALLWLRPIVDQTVSHTPKAQELARALAQYRDQLVVSGHAYRLAPEVLGRSGSVAVAALVCVPLAALASQRRWAAYVLGGALLVLAVSLVPWLFGHFSDAVSLSQSRRFAGFLPFAFAFAGGCWAVARFAGLFAPAVALAAGIALELAWPGDFGGKTLSHGGPAAATWIAAFGGAAALLVALVRPAGPEERERRRALVAVAAVCFVLPVAVHGFAHWTAPRRIGAGKLTPGLVHALRTKVPPRAVVWSDPATSYELNAYAPVSIAVAPPAHVADTKPNDPYGRMARWRAYHRSGDLAIPRRLGARFLVVDRAVGPPVRGLPKVYADARYSLYRLTG